MFAKVYPPPISLLSKISLIKDYNSYFSHTARIGREYRLCAFFTLHRLRKPHRPPSLELRSTSQRNNRNVLRDWDSSIQIRGGKELLSEKVPFLPYNPTFLQKNRLGALPLRTPPINGVSKGVSPLADGKGRRGLGRKENLFCRGVLPPQKQLGV